MGLTILDRYVLRSWIRIFVLTAFGFPVVSVLIKITDDMRKLLGKGLTVPEILHSFVYVLPEEIAMVMPASVFFATVFTLGAMSRNAELIAAHAGGLSFHRLARPIFVAAAAAALLAFAVGELSVTTSGRSLEIQKAREARKATYRYNFVYRADEGWVYTIRTLDVVNQVLKDPVFLRQGNDSSYRGAVVPYLSVSADSATYDSTAAAWRIWGSASRVIFGGLDQPVFTAQEMRLRALTQTPSQLLAASKAPAEMRYRELGEYIEALRRSGNDVNKLRVEHALKIAVPVTCIIIALFGAPLSLSSPRAGAAFGIAISLATTVLFLLIINLAKAVGSGGVIDPLVAAWAPNVMFLGAALVLLRRVQT
jgi:lipopolysaccharide export system permease protein